MEKSLVLSAQKDRWYRISEELLASAGIKINGSEPYDIQVKNNHFYKRVLQQGSLGLGESYMDGWWTCKRLDQFFTRIVQDDLGSSLRGNVRDLLRVASLRMTNPQSRKRAWIVGKEHYDLGNDLFSVMLAPWMQYSCGYWKEASTLHEAQEHQLKLICEKLRLKKA